MYDGAMETLSKSELAARLSRLQHWMQKTGVDAVFVFQSVDAYYFAGTPQTGLLCLPSAGEPLFLVQKSLSRARLESPWERLLPFPGFKQLREWLEGEGLGNLRRVGIETDVLPTSYYLKLQDLFPQVQFVDGSDAIRRTRMIKSDYEAGQVRLAGVMLRGGFDRLPGWIRPGTTELEVMAKLEGFLRSQGHPGIVRTRGFGSMIGYGAISSGASATYPVPFPGPVGSEGLCPAVPSGGGRRILAPGDSVMVDIVGGHNGYLIDKTRTYSVGELAPDLIAAHRFVLDLLRDIQSMLRPGVQCSSIYRQTLDRVKDSPYASGFMGAADNQVRFIGHGIGLELDEWPVVAGGFDIPLEPGMIIALEPKIFFPDRGGVGVENTYLITNAGFENLTPYPEEIHLVCREETDRHG
jgi:Xaa-Pro dipeptidase